ncbi:MAG: metallophosphoesterase, partial [Polyangiaceae bacterium]
TISSAAMSKPSSFPVLTCETTIPLGTASAAVNAALPGLSSPTNLALPKTDAETIIVLGDTGCRTQYGAGGTSQWQDCYDPGSYAFGTIASVAASMHPDLVIHVGDYEYRDNECPPDQAGCAGAPWGYGWDAWQDDFFKPAAPLLAAAPWVVNRGNHESCTRAGQGWYRFLDTNGYDTIPSKDCNTQGATIAADAGGGFVGDNLGGYNTPYAVKVRGDTQVIVFDTSNIAKAAITPTGSNGNQYAAYASEVQQAGGLVRACSTSGRTITRCSGSRPVRPSRRPASPCCRSCRTCIRTPSSRRASTWSSRATRTSTRRSTTPRRRPTLGCRTTTRPPS